MFEVCPSELDFSIFVVLCMCPLNLANHFFFPWIGLKFVLNIQETLRKTCNAASGCTDGQELQSHHCNHLRLLQLWKVLLQQLSRKSQSYAIHVTK